MAAYPNEAYPSDTVIEQLDATTDQRTGLAYIAKGVGPTSTPSYEVQFNRRLQRQNAILATWREGSVVDEGSLKIGVFPINYTLGGARRAYDGVAGVSIPDDSVKYVYLDADETLNVEDAFPSDAATYLPLAKVTSSSGLLAIEDKRDVAAFFVSPLGADDAPTGSISVGNESNDIITVTVQIEDAVGAALSERCLIRAWLSNSAYGPETPMAPVSFTVTTGTLLETVTAAKHLTAITDSAGQVIFDVNKVGGHTYYLNVEFDGKIVASSAITFV